MLWTISGAKGLQVPDRVPVCCHLSISIGETKSTFALTTGNVTLAIPDPTKGLKLS